MYYIICSVTENLETDSNSLSDFHVSLDQGSALGPGSIFGGNDPGWTSENRDPNPGPYLRKG